MGFNISGLAINKNFKDNFESLQKELGWNLEKQADINFESASSNWKDDGICDVYFTEKGTLLFISMDMCSESWTLKGKNTVTFALSETSMAFNLNYCEYGVETRAIMEVEGERVQDEGDRLDVEDVSEDTSEIILNQIGEVIGTTFWDIDLAEKAERYRFVAKSTVSKEENKINNRVEQIESLPYSNCSEEELHREYNRIIAVPNASTSSDALTSMSVLITEYQQRSLKMPELPKPKVNPVHSEQVKKKVGMLAKLNTFLTRIFGVACPKCLGKRQVDENDVKTFDSIPDSGTDKCAYCDGVKKVSRRKLKTVKTAACVITDVKPKPSVLSQKDVERIITLAKLKGKEIERKRKNQLM